MIRRNMVVTNIFVHLSEEKSKRFLILSLFYVFIPFHLSCPFCILFFWFFIFNRICLYQSWMICFIFGSLHISKIAWHTNFYSFLFDLHSSQFSAKFGLQSTCSVISTISTFWDRKKPISMMFSNQIITIFLRIFERFDAILPQTFSFLIYILSNQNDYRHLKVVFIG